MSPEEACAEIVRLNPDWLPFPLKPTSLQHRRLGCWIGQPGTGPNLWRAYKTPGYGRPVRSRSRAKRSFPSPAAAIRALGLPVNKEPAP